MAALFQAFLWLIRLAFDVYITFLLLRLLLQKLGANYYNPVSQFLIKMTDAVVLPLRKMMPGYRGFDLAIVFWILAAELMRNILILSVSFATFPHWLGLFIVSLGELGHILFNIYFYAILLSAVLSWFASLRQGPIAEVVALLTEPILAPVRRRMPLYHHIDFSSLIVLVVIQLLSSCVWTPLVAQGIRLSM